jgi:hypothetical protein
MPLAGTKNYQQKNKHGTFFVSSLLCILGDPARKGSSVVFAVTLFLQDMPIFHAQGIDRVLDCIRKDPIPT